MLCYFMFDHLVAAEDGSKQISKVHGDIIGFNAGGFHTSVGHLIMCL